MKIHKFNDLEPEVQALIEASITARERAYSPYSKFKVGASILCDNGVIYTGCNIENSSFSITTCAERTAAVKAVSEGQMNFLRLSVCAIQENDFVAPCGACRQTVAEFVKKDKGLEVYLVKPDKIEVLETSLEELLPLCFLL